MNETTEKIRPTTRRLPLIAFASLPLTLGLVLAQQGATGTAGSVTASSDVTAQVQRVQPAQPGQQRQNGSSAQGQTGQTRPQGSGTNYADVFLQKLAAQLGVSVTRLKSAAIAAGSATIDQGVKAGDFPSDRAAEMKQRLQQNPFAIGGGRGPGGPGMRGPGDGRHGPDGDRPNGTPKTAPSGSTSGTSGT